MTGQIANLNLNGIITVQAVAEQIGVVSNIDKKYHRPQYTQSDLIIKTAYVEKGQREYKVEFSIENDGSVMFWAIDGNDDVDDTYSESFLDFMENDIVGQMHGNTDNDEEYDDHFQNQ